MKKRFLVTSILMLLLTVFALSTSTYAWFSMNTNVTATGFQVIAKTDDTYLLISNEHTTATDIQAENNNKGFTTIDMTMAANVSKVKPSTPVLDTNDQDAVTAGGKNVDGGALVATQLVNTNTTAAVATNWYTAKAVDGTVSTMKAGTARQLTTFNEYVIVKTFYLTVAKGANDAWNLRVKPTFAQNDGGNDVDACKAIIVTDKGGFAILKNAPEQGDTDTNGYYDIKGTTNLITDSTVVKVDLYIYYDGKDDAVYTSNAANLLGATFDLSFEVDAKPAQ
jgi:hypothetical protein